MTKALPITQPMLERAIKAVRAQGLPVTGITVSPDGWFMINTSELPTFDDVTLTPTEPKPRDAREKFGA
jgi:hypothetical protein